METLTTHSLGRVLAGIAKKHRKRSKKPLQQPLYCRQCPWDKHCNCMGGNNVFTNNSMHDDTLREERSWLLETTNKTELGSSQLARVQQTLYRASKELMYNHCQSPARRQPLESYIARMALSRNPTMWDRTQLALALLDIGCLSQREELHVECVWQQRHLMMSKVFVILQLIDACRHVKLLSRKYANLEGIQDESLAILDRLARRVELSSNAPPFILSHSDFVKKVLDRLKILRAQQRISNSKFLSDIVN